MTSVAVTAPPNEELLPDESERLSTLEGTIKAGIATFIEVGKALLEIRDNRLYRADASTFEQYASERWDISRAHAYRLLGAAETVEQMSPMWRHQDDPKGDPEERAVRVRGSGLPIENERQARAIAPVVKEHGPEVAVEVLKVAAETGHVTASSIEEAAADVAPVKKATAKPPAKKATPRSRKKPASEEQLALAVDLLGDGLTALADGRLHPQAAARVAINNIQSDPKVLKAFVEEINRYYEETQK